LALIGPVDGHNALVVVHLDGTPATAFATGDFDPNWFRWKTDQRLLASIRFVTFRDAFHPDVETRLTAMDADGRNTTSFNFSAATLDPRMGIAGAQPNLTPQLQDRVVSLLPGDPDHILVEVTPVDDWEHPDVLRVDIHDGSRTLVLRKKLDVVNWIADPTGAIRAGEAIGTGAGSLQTELGILVRDDAQGDWRTIHAADVNLSARFSPISFSMASPETLYVSADNAQGRLGLYEVDIKANKITQTIASDESHDILPIEHDGELIGYEDPNDANRGVYLDPSWQHDSASRRERHPRSIGSWTARARRRPSSQSFKPTLRLTPTRSRSPN
jgi:hypothetical protein